MHIAQQMPLLLTISCSSKSRLVLPFWYLLTRVVPDIVQKSSKMVVCVCVCYCCSIVKQLCFDDGSPGDENGRNLVTVKVHYCTENEGRSLQFFALSSKNTHTQPFYCWSGICLDPPGSAGTRKVKPRRLKPIWIYWSKR